MATNHFIRKFDGGWIKLAKINYDDARVLSLHTPGIDRITFTASTMKLPNVTYWRSNSTRSVTLISPENVETGTATDNFYFSILNSNGQDISILNSLLESYTYPPTYRTWQGTVILPTTPSTVNKYSQSLFTGDIDSMLAGDIESGKLTDFKWITKPYHVYTEKHAMTEDGQMTPNYGIVISANKVPEHIIIDYASKSGSERIILEYLGLYCIVDEAFVGAVVENLDYKIERSDPYTPDDGIGSGVPSGSGGGDGSFPSDPGPSLVDRIPDGQTGNDIAQSGLFTMYLMNQQYMNLMGEILWEDNIGVQAMKKIFGNPIDSVISTISYPFNLSNLAQYSAQNLYIGPWKTDLPFQALTKSSFQIDWGTISIPFAWGNFLDYSPHTKMELFLPWGPGYVTIDPNDVSPFSNTPGNFNVPSFTAGSIQVKTNVELGKGTCVHNIIGNNGRIIGSYSGIVGKQVPITALDTGGKALTTIAAVSSIVGGVVAGSLAAKGAMDSGRLTGTPMKDPMRPFESASYWDTGMISGRASAQGLINTGSNLASRAINSTPITFPRAGTFSDGSSAMTVQTPFLIISRPVQSVPAKYGHYNGYPSNIYYPDFSNISGYTEISEIHLDNVTATADELQELDAVLKGGILL